MNKSRLVVFFTFIFLAIFFAYKYEIKKSRVLALLFTESCHPYINTNIQGINHNFIIDTGGAFHCRLDKRLCEAFPEKKLNRDLKLINLDGDIEAHKEFYIEGIRLFDVFFENFCFIPTDKSFWNKGLSSGSSTSHFKQSIQKTHIEVGSLLGHRLFDGLNFCLDFKHHTMRIYKSGLIPLFHYPFGFLTGVKKIPLIYEPELGLICVIETSYGLKRFLVDTGSPVSIIKPILPCHNLVDAPELPKIKLDLFSIQKEDYRPFDIHIEKKLIFDHIDGILGMDFFYNKVIFFDMSNYYMCIKKE